MATIASLAVQLVADPSKFVAGLSVAEKAMQRIGRSGFNPGTWAKLASGGLGKLQGIVDTVLGPIKSLLGSIPLIGGALASFPTSVGGFAEWFKEGSERINEMRITSDKLGIDIERMAGFMLAAGPASESMATAMLRLQKELGESAAKGEGTEVTFARLGLNAKQLAQMPLDQAFGQIADAINRLDNQAAKGVAVFSIFGKRGAELLPMLARGSKGLEDFQQKAREMGLAVSAVDAENVRQATMAMKSLNRWMTAAKQSVAVEMSPVVVALAEQFGQAGVNAKSVGQFALTAAKVIAYGGAVAVEAWKGLQIVWTMLKVGFQAMVAVFVEQLGVMLQAGALLPDAMGGDKFRQAAESVKSFSQGIWQDIDATRREFLDKWANDKSAFQSVDEFFAGVARKVEDAKKRMAEGPKGKDGNWERLFELFERGQKVTQEFRSPLEKIQDRIGELNELLNAGVIQWDTYARAIGAATAELVKASQTEFKMAGSADFGSQEAFTAIAKAQFGNQSQSGVDALKDGIKQQIEIQKQQKQRLDDIAIAVRGGLFQLA